MEISNTRRKFLQQCGIGGGAFLLAPALMGSSLPANTSDNPHLFGQREGYTEHMSILVSMMDWMRGVVVRTVRGLSMEELDYLMDENANSIGAMLMHLAAAEKYYHLHTIDGMEWGSWSTEIKDRWDHAMELGDEARNKIKGNPLSYYLDALEEVRSQSKEAMKEKDDSWLMESTSFFNNKPTNNYCKWFHVVEHESNHNGQIKFIKSRLPGR